jgi:hypothetical protein
MPETASVENVAFHASNEVFGAVSADITVPVEPGDTVRKAALRLVRGYLRKRAVSGQWRVRLTDVATGKGLGAWNVTL